MKVNSIFVESHSKFSKYISEWAASGSIDILNYDHKSDELPDGLLLINANQDIDKDHILIHTMFSKKHIPTQRIDVNGTLQVAVSNVDMWLNNFKCKNILVIGSDSLLVNENLDRFFARISK